MSSRVFPRLNIAELKEQDRLSEMIHRLGHEIGNPLTSIISFASVIERAGPIPPEKLATYAEAIQAEAWRITGLSEKLVLLLSTRRSETSFDLDRVVRKAASKFRKRGALEPTSASREISVTGDADQIQWAISALIQNAVEASERDWEDALPVRVNIVETESEVEVQIGNHRPEHLPHALETLFEPFVTYAPKSLGLGLTAIAAIAERQGCTISLEQRVEPNGTLFLATLSFKKGAKTRLSRTLGGRLAREEWPEAMKQVIPPLTVFVIDDEESVATAVQKILTLAFHGVEGFTCQTVTPSEFFERLSAGIACGAVLCDLNLSGTNGRAVFERLHRLSPVSAERFALLTAEPIRESSDPLFAQIPWLRKPFDAEDLVGLVVSLLAKPRHG
jgi:CheY-like chemotaxis protein